jgi:hypothetical protein
MLIAGDKLYIFYSPGNVSQIFRKCSTLRETRIDQKNFRINILGFREPDVVKIAELRGHERQIHITHLLAAEPLERTLTRYFEEFDLQLDGLGAEIAQEDDKALRKVEFELVGDILMRSTLCALLVHDSFADYPHLFRDLRQFLSEHFFEHMIGLPNFFACRAVRARERVKKRLEEVVASVEERGDVLGYIMERVQKLGELVISVEGVVSNEFDMILGYFIPNFSSPFQFHPILQPSISSLPIPNLEEGQPFFLPQIKPQLHPYNLPHPAPSHQIPLPPVLHPHRTHYHQILPAIRPLPRSHCPHRPSLPPRPCPRGLPLPLNSLVRKRGH